MSVYVDELRPTTVSRKWPYPKSCHMAADTETELHDMAQAIGLKREWFQCDHYDLTGAKREWAIARGAQKITLREMARLCRPRSKEGKS